MAKQSDTWKVVALVGGGIAAFYFLSRPETKEKMQDFVGSLLPNISLAPIDISELALPELALPDFSSQLSELIKASTPDLSDLIPSEWPSLLPDLIPAGGSTETPAEHATWTDVAYSVPSWAKGAATVVGAGLAGYGGYHLIRATAPVLKQVGAQTARAVGGAGNVIARIFGRASASGQVVKSVPTAAAGRGVGSSLAGGILPAIAFTGIIEAAYQIFRTIRGEQQIATTGVPPIDIVNLIRGRLWPFSAISAALRGEAIEPVSTLLFPSFGVMGAAPIEQLPPTEVGWEMLGLGLTTPSTEVKTPTEIIPEYKSYKSIPTRHKKAVSGPAEIIPGYKGYRSIP